MSYKIFLQKVFLTSIVIMVFITLYTIPHISHKKVLRTNLEIQTSFLEETIKIYLLNEKGKLVQTEVITSQKENLEKIEEILSYLTKENKKIPSSLYGYLPKKLKLLEKTQHEDTLILNFSKEWEMIEEEENLLSGVLYSLLELEGIRKVKFLIEGKESKKYPSALDCSFGINKEYKIGSRENIQKVIVYYYDENDYLLPITKYVNDSRNKIEIMIEELKEGKPNQISYLKEKTKLLNAKEEGNIFYMNLNQEFLEANEEIKQKVFQVISSSVFQNYSVDMLILEMENKVLKTIERK